MTLLTWNDSYSVGIASIDEQHKKLMSMINELHDGIVQKRSRDALGAVLEGLILYTGEHFTYEEQLFAQTNYGDAKAHQSEHDKLKNRVVEIHERYKSSVTGAISLEVLNFLRDWLTSHINGTDKKYSAHLVANGVT